MITKTNVQKISGTVYVRIPPHLAKYLNLDKGDEIEIQDEEGKHGKFVSFWKITPKPKPEYVPYDKSDYDMMDY